MVRVYKIIISRQKTFLTEKRIKDIPFTTYSELSFRLTNTGNPTVPVKSCNDQSRLFTLMRYNVKKKRKRQKTNFVHVIFHMCNFPNFKIYFVCFNSVKHNVELN